MHGSSRSQSNEDLKKQLSLKNASQSDEEARELRRDLNMSCTEKYIKFEVLIKDTGVGISPEGLAKLFMNFNKLEEHAAENLRGTGLGLSICKSLIELMGGSLTVESTVGVGSTFIMQLKTKCRYTATSKNWAADEFESPPARCPTYNGWKQKAVSLMQPAHEDVGDPEIVIEEEDVLKVEDDS